MSIFVGTSGYSYAEWKGSFYPAKIKSAEMLGYYSEHFTTVELNNTFYKMPDAASVERWADSVPDTFRFVLKAPRQITQYRRLLQCEDLIAELARRLEPLGEQLGAVLFGLHPNFKADVERLEQFIPQIPAAWPRVFEFRHESWDAPDIRARIDPLLQGATAASCLADTDGVGPPAVPTAKNEFGYIRLRAGSYTEAQLEAWATWVRESHRRAFVLFKHDDGAPALASSFVKHL